MKVSAYWFTVAPFLLSSGTTVLSAGLPEPTLKPDIAPFAQSTTQSIGSVFGTGAWFGIGIGRGSAAYDLQTKLYNPDDSTNYFNNSFPDLGGDGYLLTLESGYDWKFLEKYVLGVSLDLTKNNIVTNGALRVDDFGSNSAVSLDYQLAPSAQMTASMRFGYLINDSTLVYGLIGAAKTKFEADYRFIVGEDISSSTYIANVSGRTLGLGFETAISPKTSLKLEYRYSDFGIYNLQKSVINEVSAYDASLPVSTQAIRLVLAYRFSNSAPITLGSTLKSETAFDGGAWLGIGVGQGSSAYGVQTKFYNPDGSGDYFSNNYPDLGGEGALLAFEGGYDWRYLERYVLGASLDFTRTSVETSGGFKLSDFGPGSGVVLDYQLKPSTQVTALMRFGYLVNKSTLVYGVAGISKTNFDAEYYFQIDENTYNYFLNDYYSSGSYRVEVIGPTIGLGFEAMIAPKVSIKFEYRYSDFGIYNLQNSAINEDLYYDAGVSASTQAARMVLAYRF